MPLPLFPNLLPKLTDPLWFSVDQPCDDDSELELIEYDFHNWLLSIERNYSDVTPIGKTSTEVNGQALDEEEEDDDEDDNDDDDESESHDEEDEEELVIDSSYDPNSPIGAAIRGLQGQEGQ